VEDMLFLCIVLANFDVLVEGLIALHHKQKKIYAKGLEVVEDIGDEEFLPSKIAKILHNLQAFCVDLLLFVVQSN
jgi:hypothetical protein